MSRCAPSDPANPSSTNSKRHTRASGCITAEHLPVLHHTGNGMYSAVIIDPPGLPPVDHEFVFIQSEIYLGGTTEAGYQKMQNDQWDTVVFNGFVNQYAAAPIRVEPGQTIRAWVLDAGPSENSSFHVIGTIFDTVYREGHYELRPDESHGGSQALDLQPAQGGFVEFTLDKQGMYPMLTHKLSNASKGALGFFQAGEPAHHQRRRACRSLTTRPAADYTPRPRHCVRARAR